MGNFLTQAGSDFWDILRKKLPESFGMEWGIPDVPDMAKPVNMARSALNAYSSLPTASNEDISRFVQGRMARSGLGPRPEDTPATPGNTLITGPERSPNIQETSAVNPAAIKARAVMAAPPVSAETRSLNVPMSKAESDSRRAMLASEDDVAAPNNFNWGPGGPPSSVSMQAPSSDQGDSGWQPIRPGDTVYRSDLHGTDVQRRSMGGGDTFFKSINNKGIHVITGSGRNDPEQAFKNALLDAFERIRTAKSGMEYKDENEQNAKNLHALTLAGDYLRGKNKSVALPAGTELWNVGPEGEGKKLGENTNVPASVLNEQSKAVLEQRKEKSQTAKQHLDNLHKTFQSIDKDVLLTKEDRMVAKNDANTEYHVAMGVPLALAEPPNGMAFYKTWRAQKAKEMKQPVPADKVMANELQEINNARKKIIDNFVGGGQPQGAGMGGTKPKITYEQFLNKAKAAGSKLTADQLKQAYQERAGS